MLCLEQQRQHSLFVAVLLNVVLNGVPYPHLQKAIKDKDIPIDGVEFMGPNKEKTDS